MPENKESQTKELAESSLKAFIGDTTPLRKRDDERVRLEAIQNTVFERPTLKRYTPDGSQDYEDLDFSKGYGNHEVIINLGSFTGTVFKVNLYSLPGNVFLKLRFENKNTATHVLIAGQDDNDPGSINLLPYKWIDPGTGNERGDKYLGYGRTHFSGLAFKVTGEYCFTRIDPDRLPLNALVENTVPGSKLKDGTVAGSKLVDGTVPGSKLVDRTVPGSKLDYRSVGDASLQNYFVKADSYQIKCRVLTSDDLEFKNDLTFIDFSIPYGDGIVSKKIRSVSLMIVIDSTRMPDEYHQSILFSRLRQYDNERANEYKIEASGITGKIYPYWEKKLTDIFELLEYTPFPFTVAATIFYVD